MPYTNAMRLGLLAKPPTAEQMEKLLDGPLTPDKRMIRGPDGMKPLDWLLETEPDVLLLDTAHGGMELGARIRGEGRTLPVILLTDGSRVPVSRRKHELVRSRYMASTHLCMQEGIVL